MKHPFRFIRSESKSDPHTIEIYEQIGRSWWSERGIEAKAFADELKKIPRGQKIHVRINSPGGSVWDGLTIYNLLKARRQDVTTFIDGAAASIASVIALAGDKVVMPKNALMMIHDPSGFCQGTANDMLEMAAALEAHKRSIVSVYEEETEQEEDDIREKMEASTWFTGQEAYDYGLCTDLTDEVEIAARADFSGLRNVPESLLKKPAQEPGQKDKTKMKPTNLLLDPQPGIGTGGGSADPAPPAGSTQTLTTPPPTAPPSADVSNSDLRRQVDSLTAQMGKERKDRLSARIDAMVAAGRIQAGSREFWLGKAISDETVLDHIPEISIVDSIPAPFPPRLEIKAASLPDIGKHMQKLREPQDSFRRGNDISQGDMTRSAAAASDFHWSNRDRMIQILNANTIGADLKRNVILQEIVRAFAIKLLPLRAFSTVFNAVRLEGTDKVAVSYFPLVSTASTDFVAANGYVMGDSTQNAKTVTIDKRKYQPIRFDSSEIARQPALNLMQIGVMKAEKLAVDVFANILSAVTNANYGAAAFTGIASTFDAADVVDLSGVADAAEWPETGRALIIKSTYAVNMLKANVITASQLSWQNYGSVSPIQDGVVSRLAGFDIYRTEQIPANGENLVGLIAFPSGLLVATSPINPSDEVRQQLSKYELVVHPTLGIGFEYRCWGSADFDERREVIECNYGFAVGEAAGIERMVSA